VATARYAELQARKTHLIDEYPALEAALENANEAKATAFTTLAQLRGQLDVLQLANPGEQSAEAKTLARKIDDAKVLYDMAAARADTSRSFVEYNCQEMTYVRSEIDAIRGALLDAC